jgi:hypothetical protein
MNVIVEMYERNWVLINVRSGSSSVTNNGFKDRVVLSIKHSRLVGILCDLISSGGRNSSDSKKEGLSSRVDEIERLKILEVDGSINFFPIKHPPIEIELVTPIITDHGNGRIEVLVLLDNFMDEVIKNLLGHPIRLDLVRHPFLRRRFLEIWHSRMVENAKKDNSGAEENVSIAVW